MHRRELLKRLSVLTGGSLSLACQQALSVPPTERRVTGRVYDEEVSALVERLADLIIPTTDTLGAAAAGAACGSPRLSRRRLRARRGRDHRPHHTRHADAERAGRAYVHLAKRRLASGLAGGCATRQRTPCAACAAAA